MSNTEFFSLGHAVGGEVGKTYPQSQVLHEELSRSATNHINNQRPFSIWPENAYVPSPVLDRKAKKTDLISTTSVLSSKLVISSKMKQVIQQYRQTGLQYFKTSVLSPLPLQMLHKFALESHDYWVVNFYETDYQYVDFSKSEVSHLGIGRVILSRLDIKSVWDFNTAEKELVTIWIDKMVLCENVRDHFIHIPRVNGGPFFVSGALKNALEKARCTGINFEPLKLY